MENIAEGVVSDPEGLTTSLSRGKKKGKQKSSSSQTASSSSSSKKNREDRDLKNLIAAYDHPWPKPPPPLTEEEKQWRYDTGRNYVIRSFNRHNKENHYLSCMWRLKNHAIQMMPKKGKLKEEALKVELGEHDPPIWRHIPSDFPPIPGFDPESLNFAEDEEDEEDDEY